MTEFIFIGDMLVMAFMIGVAIWFINRNNDAAIDHTARIPLEDDDYNG
jgi:cbb3-type cytochrome oxidase subunit 3